MRPRLLPTLRIFGSRRSSAMNDSARHMFASQSLSGGGGRVSRRLMEVLCECNCSMVAPARELSICNIPSTLRPPAPVYSPTNRRRAVPGGARAGIGASSPSNAARVSSSSSTSRLMSCLRRFTRRFFPFFDVFVISNASMAIVSATHFFQSSTPTARAFSRNAARSRAASSGSSNASSSSSEDFDEPSLVVVFFPPPRLSNPPGPPSTSHTGAAPPTAEISVAATAPGYATCAMNSADVNSSDIDSVTVLFAYVTGISSALLIVIPAGNAAESLLATSLGSLGSTRIISKSSARLDAPSGKGIAVLILNLELYGESDVDTGSAARLAARSSRRSVSRCPMKISSPCLVKTKRRRCVFRPSGSW